MKAPKDNMKSSLRLASEECAPEPFDEASKLQYKEYCTVVVEKINIIRALQRARHRVSTRR